MDVYCFSSMFILMYRSRRRLHLFLLARSVNKDYSTVCPLDGGNSPLYELMKGFNRIFQNTMKSKQFLQRFTWLSIIFVFFPANASSTWVQFTSAGRVLSRSISPWASGSSVVTVPTYSWWETSPQLTAVCSRRMTLTQCVERLHISSRSFFFFPVDGDFGQDVGPMSTLPESVSSFTPACVREESDSWSEYFCCLCPAPPLAGRTPGSGACCASCSSLSLSPPLQDLWWVCVSACVCV